MSIIFLFIALAVLVIEGFRESISWGENPPEIYELYFFTICAMLLAIYFRLRENKNEQE